MKKTNNLSIFIFSFILICACNNQKNSEVIKINVTKTLQKLEESQDTDLDKKITVEDTAIKRFEIVNESNSKILIEGNYPLSNLLQELAAAKEKGLEKMELSLNLINETPSKRISRLIRTKYWDNLTRSIDAVGLQLILEDSKSSNRDKKTLYVPSTDTTAFTYFKDLEAKMNSLQMVVLPEEITPEYVKSINDQPGILSLKIQNGKGNPFVVPGGRFNEMYG